MKKVTFGMLVGIIELNVLDRRRRKARAAYARRKALRLSQKESGRAL